LGEHLAIVSSFIFFDFGLYLIGRFIEIWEGALLLLCWVNLDTLALKQGFLGLVCRGIA
jgi:hypothetical protein